MNDRTAALQNKVSKLMANGKYDEAYSICQKLLKLFSGKYGPLSREVARIHNRLGLCLLAKNDPKHAAKEFQRGIDSLDRNEDWANSIDKSIYLVNAGAAKHSEGKYREGDLLFIEAAKLRKPLAKPDDDLITTILDCYGEQIPGEQSENRLINVANRAIWLAELMYGMGYMSCVALEKLVETYQENARHIAAEKILHHLVCRYYKLFGQFSKPYGDASFRLAQYLQDNEYAKAVIAREEAVAVSKKAKENEKPFTEYLYHPGNAVFQRENSNSMYLQILFPAKPCFHKCEL